MTLTRTEQILLNEFVDRTAEVERFTKLLEDDRRPIMLISGEEGMGKSAVTVKLVAACAEREVVIVRVTWTNTYNVNELSIMRSIRDALGEEHAKHFSPFNDLINFYSVPNYKLTVLIENKGSISVAENMQVAEGGQVGDVAAVIIKDNNFEPKDSYVNSVSEQRARLSDLFFRGLKQALEKKSLVVFIDQIDDMVVETREWIWHVLVRQVLDLPIPNVRLVLCVDEEPELDDIVRRFFVPGKKLPPLEHAHIVELLQKRGLVFKDYDEAAKMILVFTEGNLRKITSKLGSL